MRIQIAVAGMVLAAASAASAQQTSPDQWTNPCAGSPWWTDTNATFEDFDFWVGQWQVFHKESGQMVGFDVIEKDQKGCTLRQHWRQMNDLFRPQNAPMRLEGKSVTGISGDGVWRQLWTDHFGGNTILTGGLSPNGDMMLVSEWYSAPTQSGGQTRTRNRWFWRPIDHNTIENWGEFQTGDDTGAWTEYFRIIYRRNAPGGATVEQQRAE